MFVVQFERLYRYNASRPLHSTTEVALVEQPMYDRLGVSAQYRLV